MRSKLYFSQEYIFTLGTFEVLQAGIGDMSSLTLWIFATKHTFENISKDICIIYIHHVK